MSCHCKHMTSKFVSFSVCVTYSELDLKEFKTRNKVIIANYDIYHGIILIKILDYEPVS